MGQLPKTNTEIEDLHTNEAPQAPNFLNLIPLLHTTYNEYYDFYFQREEIFNALETTILLGIEFKSHEVLDVLPKYVAQHYGIVDFQLKIPKMSIFKSIQMTTAADDERKLGLAMVDSTDQIRAKCDFELEDIESLLKNDLPRWEFVTDTKYLKVSTISKLNHKIPICLTLRKIEIS